MRVTAREIGVVEGVWDERHLDSAGHRAPGRLRAAKGDLYVFVNLQEPELEAEALEREIRDQIAQAYYRETARSITASLVRALSAANEDFYAMNKAAVAVHRRCADVVCVALRGEDVYVAQVGSSLAYLVLPEGIQELTRPGPTLGGVPEGLGSAADVAAELSHHRVSARCSIVLSSATLAEVAPPSALRQLLVLRDDLDVAVALRALVGASGAARDLRAVVVDVEGPARQTVRREGVAAPQPQAEPVSGDDGDEAATEASAPGEPAVGMPAEQARLEAHVSDGGDLRLGDRAVRGLQGVGAFARRCVSSTSRLMGRLLILLTILLAIFAAVVVPLRLWQDRQEGVAEVDLVARAEQKEREALAVEDPGQRLRLMTEANELAARASRLRRGDAQAQAVSRRIQGQLDVLSGAVRLTSPIRLLSLDGEPTQLILGGGDLYVLDRAVDRVFRYPLAPDGQAIQPAARPVVFRRGDRLGEVVVAAPSRLLWMPAGSARPADALLMLDEAGELFEFDPSRGARPLRSVAPWKPTQVFAGYAGSLFVLDSQAGTLRWHPPSSDGYDRAAYPYLQPEVAVPVDDGVALAVDGDLYLLRSNGRIERFVTGRPLPFVGAVPDRPLRAPASLIATRRAVYAVDVTNRRLVEFDREGGFRRQYLFEGEDLVGVALDEARGLVYYLGRQGVYLYRLGEVHR